MHLIYDVRCSRTPVVSAIPGIDYKPFNIVDGQMDTSWQVHGRTGVISIYFHGAGSGGPATVQGIQIYGGFRSKAEWYWGNHRPARVRVSDGVRSQVLSVADNGGPLLGSLGWENVSVLHIEVLNVYSGSEWDDLAISEVVLY